MVDRDGVGDLLEEHRLAGSRRSDDECSLSLADRCQQVHDSHGDRGGTGFELDVFERVNRRQFIERLDLGVFFERSAVDGFDVAKSRSLGFRTGDDFTAEHDPFTESIAFDQRAGNERIVLAGGVVILGISQETIALGV